MVEWRGFANQGPHRHERRLIDPPGVVKKSRPPSATDRGVRTTLMQTQFFASRVRKRAREKSLHFLVFIIGSTNTYLGCNHCSRCLRNVPEEDRHRHAQGRHNSRKGRRFARTKFSRWLRRNYTLQQIWHSIEAAASLFFLVRALGKSGPRRRF